MMTKKKENNSKINQLCVGYHKVKRFYKTTTFPIGGRQMDLPLHEYVYHVSIRMKLIATQFIVRNDIVSQKGEP